MENSLVEATLNETNHVLPMRETPGYRVRANAAGCSVVELLATLIGGPNASPTAERLLSHFGSAFALSRAQPAELLQVMGVGPQVAARLLAAFELPRRAQADLCDPVIRSAADAAQWLIPRFAHHEQEHFAVLPLNARNRLIGEPVTLYRGSVNSALVRAGEVFRDAIRCNALSVILGHNHPSGDPSPSVEDVAMTRGLIEAGRLLGIEVLDHIVLGHQRFVSLKERGLAFADA